MNEEQHFLEELRPPDVLPKAFFSVVSNKWEYKIFTWEGYREGWLTVKLNEYGQTGWELVSVTDVDITNYNEIHPKSDRALARIVFYFKRPKVES